MGLVVYSRLAERKISAWIQEIGVGPKLRRATHVHEICPGGRFLTRLGISPTVADGLKFMFKEDFTPAGVKKIYFLPRSGHIGDSSDVDRAAVIPFGSQIGNQQMVIADLNVGILYTLRLIVSMGVYGIVLAGYAANSNNS